MNEETRIPAQRDLPPGRLQQRKELLVREVSLWDGALRRRRRRLALVLVPAVVAVLAVTGFTTYALTREPTQLESIGCFEQASLDANVSVVSADGRDPAVICTEIWEQYGIEGGPAPKRVASCVLESGAVGVFPSSGQDTCEQLGLADLPPTYAAEAERFAALRDAIEKHLGIPPSGTSEGDLKCLSEEDARSFVRQELEAHGYEDWGMEVIGDGFVGRPCTTVSLGFDGERKVVFLVPDEG
jgi:hypothetical protein